MNYEKYQIIKRIRDLGMKDAPFMIVGVRSKADKPNEFDDKFYLITKSKFLSFTGTTNPGRHWLLNFLNPKGTALLKPDKMYFFKLGKHNNSYEALVQAEPFTVYRDTDKDEKSEEQGIEDIGWFGINLHRANPSAVSKFIDKWSAGCQVLNNPADFNYLIQECKDSKLEKFPYYLLREW